MDFLRVMVWTNLIVYLTIVIYMIIDIRRNSSKLENSQCKISVDQENKKTTNYPDKGGNEIQKPGNPETKKITGANNSNDNKKSIEPAQIDKIPIDSSEKNSSSNMNKDGEKSTIEFDQSNPEKGQTRSRLLEDAANAATERIKAEKLLSTAEMYATKAQTKIQTALERIKSAISLLNEGKLNLVENEARTAVGPATDAITAAQAFSRENMLINPVVIGEFPNDFSTDSDLVSIIATARGNARIVNDAIEKLNSKKEIVNDSQSAAEKVIAKIPLLIAAANVALEHAKANAVLSEATKVQENSEAASAAIDLAKFLLKEGKLYLVEKEVQNADRSATNAITAAETFNTDKNSITPIHIDELPTELSKDSDLKSIMSAARENATKVKNAIITLMSKEAIIKSKQSAAKKAKAAVPFLRAASKAAHERQKADKLLPNIKMLASKVEQKSRAATSAIDSAKIALQTDRLDDVETEALKAERSSIQAIEAAQNFSYDKNVISSVVIDKLPDELSSDSDMKSIKSIADENAAKVREAIRTMNTEEATVISSQSSAEKAKKAIPLLHVALQAARERKKADKLLPNVEMLASEVERKSLAASSAIHSAKIALQTDRLDDVETEALKAESSAIEAIKAAQNFSYDKNSISSVDIDDFSANASEGSGLASIKSKVENDAAEVKKAIETINLKRASVISSQSAAEKAKAAVPLLRSAAKVAIERKKADAVLSIANKAEEQSQAASKIIESAMDLLEHGNLDLVENKALDAETPATVAIAAAQNFRRDKNSINSIDIAELPAVLSTDSDLESIKSKADDDAVEVNAAIGMIRTKEASVISSQSAAEKAKAAVPFLRIALAVAGERKNADTFLPEVETYASEAELKSQAASRAIESAISALQNDQLTDVETEANNAEHSATEAITAAQKLITNTNTVTPINIDEFSANVTEGSVLASIKTKVEDDAAKVKKANKTINLKRESVILHKATAEKAKAAVPFLRIALAVAGERKNADTFLPKVETYASEAELKSQAASRAIESAISALQNDQPADVETQANNAEHSATEAITAAQKLITDTNTVTPINIDEFSANVTEGSVLASIKTKVEDDAAKVTKANKTINLKRESVILHKATAEKAKAAVPFLRIALAVAGERKNADTFLPKVETYASEAELKSQAASRAIESAISALQNDQLTDVETEANNADHSATEAITAAQKLITDTNTVTPINIDEFSANVTEGSVLASIKTKVEDDAAKVMKANKTINLKRESVILHKATAEKAKAAVPFLRIALAVAGERKNADTFLPEVETYASEAELKSQAASRAIESAISALQNDQLTDVKTEANNADHSATEAITAAQKLITNTNTVTPINIDEFSANVTEGSVLASIKTKVEDDAAKVKKANKTINLKRESVILHKATAEKAKAAVPFLRIALAVAGERKNADTFLPKVETYASEAELKSQAASRAIESAISALQNDQLTDVETQANNAEHSATEAITAAQKLMTDTNTVTPINIDEFSANVTEGSVLASIKTKVEDDAAKVMKANKTINLKRESVILHKATAEKAKAAVPFLRIALAVADERKNADTFLPEVETYASEAELKSQAASRAIESAISALQNDQPADVETQANNAEHSATKAITAAQKLITDTNTVTPINIDEFSANVTEGSVLASIKSKVEDDAAKVKKVNKTINLKRESVILHKATAEKAKAAVPFLRIALAVAGERKNADTFLPKVETYASEAELKSQAASRAIESAISALQNDQLTDVETQANNAEHSATEAITAAQKLITNSNTVTPINIDEFSANVTEGSVLASIKTKVEDDAAKVKKANKTINLKRESVILHKATAEKAKAAVPFLRIALAVAGERKNADTFLPKVETYASEAELKSQAASRAIESAISALQNDQLTDVETQANNAEHSATEAITAAQKLITDTNTVTPINIDEFSANVTEGSVLASIKTKVEDDAAKVMKANKTINLKRESVILHKATAEKAKAAVPFLRIALAVAGERKNADTFLPEVETYASEAELKSQAASRAIESAISALQNDQLTDVETQANNAEHSATEAITAAQKLITNSNTVTPINIDEFSANVTEGSVLASIKTKVEDDAAKVKKANKTINLKRESVILHKATAEKAKAAVPFLRIALAVAGERKNADTFLPEVETYASEAELKSQAASRAIESAISALQNDQLTDVETQANNAEHSATEAITAAQKLITNSNTVTPINIDEFSANVTEGSVLASIKTKVEDDAAKVKKANKTINLKRESVILHKATAEKAKAAVPFLRIALAVAGERKNATERVPRAQNSAAESAKNAKKAADILSDVKSADPSLSDSISLQADVALSLASQAIANARTFSSTKRLVDYAATKARQSATQISDEFADIKAIANKFAMEAEEASNTLAKLVDSVKTSKSSAGSTQTEASTLVEM